MVRDVVEGVSQNPEYSRVFPGLHVPDPPPAAAPKTKKKKPAAAAKK